jgi:hypothetical protein
MQQIKVTVPYTFALRTVTFFHHGFSIFHEMQDLNCAKPSQHKEDVAASIDIVA